MAPKVMRSQIKSLTLCLSVPSLRSEWAQVPVALLSLLWKGSCCLGRAAGALSPGGGADPLLSLGHQAYLCVEGHSVLCSSQPKFFFDSSKATSLFLVFSLIQHFCNGDCYTAERHSKKDGKSLMWHGLPGVIHILDVLNSTTRVIWVIVLVRSMGQWFLFSCILSYIIHYNNTYDFFLSEVFGASFLPVFWL